MTKRLRFLDLFSGAGGAAMGMHRAYPQAEIIGVDIKPQPHYPFTFVQGDALNPPFDLKGFDFIWASPPCQGYSRLLNLPWLKGRKYPKLIPQVREMLVKTGKPFVIENVAGAPLNGAELCGAAIGLKIRRHRLFESNNLLLFPPCPGHPVIQKGRASLGKRYPSGVTGVFKEISRDSIAGHFAGVDQARKDMGIDWMVQHELAQAIPPAYSEYILKQMRLG